MKSSQRKSLAKLLKRYWRAYGGTKEIISSPFFVISCFATFVFFPVWVNSSEWAGDASEMLIALVGLSLAAFSILLGFSDSTFISKIAGTADKEDSVYIIVCAAFLHFIIVQFSALTLTIMVNYQVIEMWLRMLTVDFRIMPNNITAEVINVFKLLIRFCAFLGFAYSMALIAASGLAVFRLSTWYDRAIFHSNKKEGEQNS